MTATLTGVHKMTDADYFAHPALSHSDTRILLDSPAKFAHLRGNPRDAKPPTDDMRFGTAVHAILLGGPHVVEVAADSWRTNAAKEERAEAEANGCIALLTADFDRAHACAMGANRHPQARKLLDNADDTEIVGIWDDGDVQRRAKLDLRSGRFGVDIKTAYSAATDDFARSAAKYGYFTQDPWYRDCLTACWGIDDPAFLFIVIEKEPPYLVNVVELDPYDVELGRKRNQRAIDLYRQCRDADEWPGYGDDVNLAALPGWARWAEESNGPDDQEEMTSW